MSLAHKIFLSCKTATEYLEKKSDKSLNFKGRLQLRLHLAICKVCRIYEKQGILIGKLLGLKHNTASLHEHTPEEIENLKNDILEKIKPE